jgi:hypothetical protein
MANYEIWHTDDAGNRLDLVNIIGGFELVMVDGDVGWFVPELPYDATRLYNNPARDRRFHVYRAPAGGSLELLAVTFLRRWNQITDRSGLSRMIMEAADTNELLSRRIVAYKATTSQTAKSDYADDMMKEIVDENLGGSATDTDRDITGNGVSIAGDLSDGPSISQSFAYKNVMAALQKIQQTSKAAGNEVFFKMRAATPTSFIFETYTGQPGADRTHSGGSPMFFGAQFGNISNAQLQELYDNEENVIYAGGAGRDTLRVLGEAEDSTAVSASRWNRREGFLAATRNTTEAAADDAAESRLTERRGKVLFRADLNPTPAAPFGGTGWGMGDKITVSHQGQQIDCLIRAVKVRVDGRGQETVSARVEAIL